MKKIILGIMFAFAFVGCATKSDVGVLNTRVNSLEATDKVTANDIETIKANQEAIKGEVADLVAKFDRAFAKSMKK